MIITGDGTAQNEYETRCRKCGKKYSWIGKDAIPCPHCQKEKKQKASDVEAALNLVADIESLVEDLPEEGEDFGLSVSEKAQDIGANIEAHNRVTDGQFSALENMLEGLQRWFHD